MTTRPAILVGRTDDCVLVSAPRPVRLTPAETRAFARALLAAADALDPPMRAVGSVLPLRRRPDDVPGVVHRIVTKQEQLAEVDAETRDGGPKGAA